MGSFFSPPQHREAPHVYYDADAHHFNARRIEYEQQVVAEAYMHGQEGDASVFMLPNHFYEAHQQQSRPRW